VEAAVSGCPDTAASALFVVMAAKAAAITIAHKFQKFGITHATMVEAAIVCQETRSSPGV